MVCNTVQIYSSLVRSVMVTVAVAGWKARLGALLLRDMVNISFPSTSSSSPIADILTVREVSLESKVSCSGTIMKSSF